MRHHFVTKLDITKAAINYLYEKRLNAFREASASTADGKNRVRRGLEVFWKQVRHPHYMAFFELSVSSRTDKALAEILKPAEQAFNEAYIAQAKELFPEWDKHPQKLEIALNMTRYLLEGLAVDVIARDSAEVGEMILLLEKMIIELREDNHETA